VQILRAFPVFRSALLGCLHPAPSAFLCHFITPNYERPIMSPALRR
jgi:hypothetical protein